MTTTYTVQKGDTLTRIARSHDTTVDALAKLNALKDPDKIRVGQQLQVPDRFEAPTAEYVVKSGDTLSAVAREHKTTVGKLQELNNITDPDRIRVGQKLRVPTDAPAPSQPKSASAARTDSSGAVHATINGREQKIGANGTDAIVTGNGRYVAYIDTRAELGRPTVQVYDVQTATTKTLPVDFNALTSVRGHVTSNGRTALILEGSAGARGVPVLAVATPDKGIVFTPNDSASLSAVKGDTLHVQNWGRAEGEYEVSPSTISTHDLRALV